MARTTFQKRQKEMKRRERQQMKAEKRQNRKLTKTLEPQTAPPAELDTTAINTPFAEQESDHEI